MASKATGWDARDAQFAGHNVFVEGNDGEPNHYRWECSCRRSGRWVKSKSYAEELGEKHAERYRPKPTGPAGLQKLLKLG